MIIGTPKEIKNNEFRVAITPAGVKELVQSHTLLIQKGAGDGSGFQDEDYIKAGAKIVNSAKEIFDQSELILKVKEPLPEEYGLIKKDQIIFTYLHLAASEELTKALVDSGATCIAYETIEDNDGNLPLLTPMSMVAGRLSVQLGMHFLLSPTGRGVLPGGIDNTDPCNVLILGGGVVGTEAAKVARGMGANVTILDINQARLLQLSSMLSGIETDYSDENRINRYLPMADLVVGAVLVHGGKAPKLIRKDQLKLMQKGAVIVDVAVDQGGCVETSKVTTHEDPIFTLENVVHCGVANLPGAVPITSTMALTNHTLPYIKKIADHGWIEAVKKDNSLLKGVNITEGKVTYEEVAETFGLPYFPLV